MPHLITFKPHDDAPTAAVAQELRYLVERWSSSIREHLISLPPGSAPLRMKRETIRLPAPDGVRFSEVREGEKLGELINVLATVVRTADVLDYLAEDVGGRVLACNPTTSNVGHDVEVLGDDGSRCVVEVSDVAGKAGNANGKMTKDLTTLLSAPAGTSLLLAVSATSSAWLTGTRTLTTKRLGVRCEVVGRCGGDHEVATHIVSVTRSNE